MKTNEKRKDEEKGEDHFLKLNGSWREGVKQKGGMICRAHGATAGGIPGEAAKTETGYLLDTCDPF